VILKGVHTRSLEAIEGPPREWRQKTGPEGFKGRFHAGRLSFPSSWALARESTRYSRISTEHPKKPTGCHD
jgi:hypothetical protein